MRFDALLELDQIVVQTGMVGTRQYEDQANGRGVLLRVLSAHSSSPDAPLNLLLSVAVILLRA